MNNLTKKLLPAFFLLAAFNTKAQTGGRDFSKIDAYVKSLGSLETMSMGTINNVVSNKFTDKMDKARAIYDWVATNITYDVKAGRTNNTANNTPAEVLKTRKAVAIGFANLFQDMCSSADIRCLTVDGFVKYSTLQIGEKDQEINHSWAVVQLGQTPEEWFYVDPAFGSGFLSADKKEFTKSFSDAFFFTEKACFNLQHFPDNKAWKLGNAPKDKGDFFNLPVIKTGAMDLGITKCIPDNGKLKVKADKPTKFSFTLKSTEYVVKVQMAIGTKKKYRMEEVQSSGSGGVLSFTYKFKDSDSGPLTILVNGKEFVQYDVEVE